MKRRFGPAMLAAVLVAAVPGIAHATPVSATLSGANGEGTFNDTLDCLEAGDGDSFRYTWQDQPATGGLLAGTWNGSFEVHQGLFGAFVPEGDGRIAITLGGAGGRSGTAGFDTTAAGSCADAGLALTTQPDGDPQVTGSLPIAATGGTGALRGLTGTGTLSFALELGPGADNAANLQLAGDFDVAAPTLTVGATQARYLNLTEWLARRVRLYVTVANTGPGDAFGVRLTGVTGGTGRFSGLPAGPQDIPAGQSRTFALTMDGASANQTYTIAATTAGSDGLLAAQPASTGPSSFKTPLLP
jgi:hypothetical protein